MYPEPIIGLLSRDWSQLTVRLNHKILRENPPSHKELCRFRDGHKFRLKDAVVVRKSVGKSDVRNLNKNTVLYFAKRFGAVALYLQGSPANFIVFRSVVSSRNKNIKSSAKKIISNRKIGFHVCFLTIAACAWFVPTHGRSAFYLTATICELYFTKSSEGNQFMMKTRI